MPQRRSLTPDERRLIRELRAEFLAVKQQRIKVERDILDLMGLRDDLLGKERLIDTAALAEKFEVPKTVVMYVYRARNTGIV